MHPSSHTAILWYNKVLRSRQLQLSNGLSLDIITLQTLNRLKFIILFVKSRQDSEGQCGSRTGEDTVVQELVT